MICHAREFEGYIHHIIRLYIKKNPSILNRKICLCAVDIHADCGVIHILGDTNTKLAALLGDDGNLTLQRQCADHLCIRSIGREEEIYADHTAVNGNNLFHEAADRLIGTLGNIERINGRAFVFKMGCGHGEAISAKNTRGDISAVIALGVGNRIDEIVTENL